MDDLIGGKQCKISQADLNENNFFFNQTFDNIDSVHTPK